MKAAMRSEDRAGRTPVTAEQAARERTTRAVLGTTLALGGGLLIVLKAMEAGWALLTLGAYLIDHPMLRSVLTSRFNGRK